MIGKPQRHDNRLRMLACLASAAFPLLAPLAAFAADPKVAPATVEKIEGSEVARVTLVERASERLGIKTEPVREEMLAPRGADAPPALRKVIAYSAVIYDTNGGAWAYTNPEPLAFLRQPITIEYTRGDMTVLTAGPPTGTQVVVIGAAELFGAETGVK